MTTCSRCGHIIMPANTAYAHAGWVCSCYAPGKVIEVGPGDVHPMNLSRLKPTPMGWQCPVCKTVHAPHQKTCVSCGPVAS